MKRSWRRADERSDLRLLRKYHHVRFPQVPVSMATRSVLMPWKIEKGRCPAGKPWAVVQIADDKVVGCHTTKEKAQKQVAALNINVHKRWIASAP